MAWALSIIMMFGAVPSSVLTAFAATGEKIVEFTELNSELPDDVALQIEPLGTALTALVLPEILTARIFVSDDGTDPEHYIEDAVVVSWESTPSYNGNTPGKYVFKVSEACDFNSPAEEYIIDLDLGVEAPTISARCVIDNEKGFVIISDE